MLLPLLLQILFLALVTSDGRYLVILGERRRQCTAHRSPTPQMWSRSSKAPTTSPCHSRSYYFRFPQPLYAMRDCQQRTTRWSIDELGGVIGQFEIRWLVSFTGSPLWDAAVSPRPSALAFQDFL